MSERLILGTRGSELALTQTRMTRAFLSEALPQQAVEHRVIRTIGDKRPDLKLSEFSQGDSPVLDKGIFTKELELALEAGEVHAAVHSLKDVPTELAEGFEISVVLPRAPVEDVLVSKAEGGLEGLGDGAVVATSSVRRKAQLEALREDLVIEDIRGNVPTRLAKLRQSEVWGATVLARAGLERLGYSLEGGVLEGHGERFCAEILDPGVFVPASGQGAGGIETFRAEGWVLESLGSFYHAETMTRVRAERHFLHLLEAGCQTPVGAFTRIEGGRLAMEVIVFDERGCRRASAECDSDAPEEVAEIIFKEIK
ncbi:MAG: hydroxymethylbilane synthase [Verrucomicrobiales bacterium]|nr:hydroxymethylbilane synthase [Verrucomicrobiales bacterium]